jgi:phospholipase C
LGPETPLGRDIPVDHFIFVVQENRSFDHYFQAYQPAPGSTVEVAPPTWAAISPHRRHPPIKPFAIEHPCPADPPHLYESVLLAWRGGKMDGFALAGGADSVGFLRSDLLGYYHALAVTFALSDRHFADFMGPTWPNRLFMLSATSFGHTDNTAPPKRDLETSLFHQLDEQGLTWRVYADGKVYEEGMYPALRARRHDNFRSVAEFMDDAKNGTLPALAWVESTHAGAHATDEHPPANVEVGQLWVSKVVDATMRGAAWNRSLLLITYDEHGGFFDHVPPPSACEPDHLRVHGKKQHVAPRFDYFGMRVPLLIVSPWAKRGYVSHVPTSHASLLRLVQARFGLPALTRRDANATPPFDMLDLRSPPRLDLARLPEPRVEPLGRKRCQEVPAIPSDLPH